VCDDGYALAGPAAAACVAPGVFDGPAGECEPLPCGPYPAPAHGTAEPGGPVGLGDAVGIRCDEGYRLVGPERAECGAGGEYSEVRGRVDAVFLSDNFVNNKNCQQFFSVTQLTISAAAISDE
jgi:hypothetical protein